MKEKEQDKLLKEIRQEQLASIKNDLNVLNKLLYVEKVKKQKYTKEEQDAYKDICKQVENTKKSK